MAEGHGTEQRSNTCVTCRQSKQVCCDGPFSVGGEPDGPFCAVCCPGKKTDHGNFWKKSWEGVLRFHAVYGEGPSTYLGGDCLDYELEDYDGKRVCVTIQVLPEEA